MVTYFVTWLWARGATVRKALSSFNFIKGHTDHRDHIVDLPWLLTNPLIQMIPKVRLSS